MTRVVLRYIENHPGVTADGLMRFGSRTTVWSVIRKLLVAGAIERGRGRRGWPMWAVDAPPIVEPHELREARARWLAKRTLGDRP